MRKINLAYPEKTDIKFKVSPFPDGQQTIDIETPRMSLQGQDIRIDARIRTFRDLELIIAANQALHEMAVASVSLYVPYFLGARSDRKFREGGVNYLKHVICPVINSQKFNTVVILDPHSDVLEACLDNYDKVSNFTVVKHALTDIDNRNGAQDRIVLVSPDGGALKKIYDVAEEFQINNIITAMKHRDIKTGKITHTEIPDISQYGEDHKFVIVDDICDGGRTFIELSKAIRKHNSISDIYLIVTHGIFSSGLTELSKYFTKIYTTNSVKDIVNDSEDTSAEREGKQIVTQFNVFA
jgi:ribose-phosphate pyrophosphokinase